MYIYRHEYIMLKRLFMFSIKYAKDILRTTLLEL